MGKLATRRTPRTGRRRGKLAGNARDQLPNAGDWHRRYLQSVPGDSGRWKPRRLPAHGRNADESTTRFERRRRRPRAFEMGKGDCSAQGDRAPSIGKSTYKRAVVMATFCFDSRNAAAPLKCAGCLSGISTPTNSRGAGQDNSQAVKVVNVYGTSTVPTSTPPAAGKPSGRASLVC